MFVRPLKDPKKILAESGAIISGDHFVYKAGTHGEAYINKEKFAMMGALKLKEVIDNAASAIIRFNSSDKEVGIAGPAMGAITYALTMAVALEEYYELQKVKDDLTLNGKTTRNFYPELFFPARTELKEDSTGKRIHVIPEKLKADYEGKSFIIFEDIVNNGTTIREVKELLEKEVNARIIGVICIADRGGQTAKSLGVEQYSPLMRVNMAQHKAIECPLCAKGVPINTVLGKGKNWVNLFGQPPYKSGTDFSAFWEK